MLHKVSLPISQGELRERIYRGDILHFPRMPAVDKFCDFARQICESNLVSLDPVNSHKTVYYSGWLKAVYQFQLAAQDEQQCKMTFSETLESIGLKLDETFCDRFIFRVVPPESDQAEGAHSWVDTHRDTWGAGIYQQINWWAPLYPYESTSGIEFYLDHFDRPIANTTAEWRYNQFTTARQQQSAELKPVFKAIPSLLEKPSGQIFRPVIEPGELLCFSAAHLHGSGTNATGHSRFSYETRTVNLQDIRSGKKARNVDNDSNAQLLKLFKNLSDGSPLTKAHFELPC
jgi:hypothetical protein